MQRIITHVRRSAPAIILQIIAWAISAAGSDTIFAASFFLELAAAAIVFTTLTVGLASIWCINKSIVCGLGSLFFFGSCLSWCIEKCIVAAVCGIIDVAKVLRATLIFVGSCGIGILFFFGSCFSWCIEKCIVAAVCGIIGVAKVLRATSIFVRSGLVGAFKPSWQ